MDLQRYSRSLVVASSEARNLPISAEPQRAPAQANASGTEYPEAIPRKRSFRRAMLRERSVLSLCLPFVFLSCAATILLWTIDTRRLTSRFGLLAMLLVIACTGGFVAYELLRTYRTYELALTQAEKASAEIEAREAHFRVLAETIPHMVWAAGPDGTVEYFNQRWFDYTGLTPGTSPRWLDRIHPDDERSTRLGWRASLTNGKAFSMQLRLRNASSGYRWHLGRALALRNEQGTIVRWLGTFTDVDDQKRAEEAILRLATIVETSEDAIFSKDLDGHIKSWNRGAEKMYGYLAHEMIGQHFSILSAPERRNEVEEILASIRNGQSIEHLESARVRKDGTLIEVSLSFSPIRDARGVITGASVIARDVTERNRAAEALRKTEKLAATGRLAGTIAHEINNPLEAVTHLVYLLERHPSLNDEARQYARIAMEEVDRIGRIAKQALGFYREASAPVQVNIAELVESVVQLYRAAAQNKNVSLESQSETSATVPAFPGEMRQIFSNLIVNAVDAVPRGGTVKVRVKHARDWKSRALGIRVLVADNGPGIPDALRSRVFEPFFTTKGEKGTGVGLWVSEGVVHKHGGSIRVKSATRATHGTTFAVFLPYRENTLPV